MGPMIKIIPAVLGLFFAATVFAGPPEGDRKCPDPGRLWNVCSELDDATKDDQYMYLYKRTLYEAACVDKARDSREIVRAKMQALWALNPKEFRCNASNFDVTRGDLLKYAVNLRKFELVGLAAREWQVNLNRIDQGGTLLDYLGSHIERSSNSPQQVKLKDYYRLVRKYGAKHKSEMSEAEIVEQSAAPR